MSMTRPQVWFQADFVADPNDGFMPPVWSDLSEMVTKMVGYARGRQYELAESRTADPDVTFFDPSELLNPANTSSPYAAGLEPYRRFIGQAMYPNGGVGNLLNALAWRPNDAAPFDPSFESYANGASLPGWLTAVGGTVPTITTSNPQQGTKSLTYTVAAAATNQGVSWTVVCVPGQQYTVSCYVRQTSASTQQLAVKGLTGAFDRFRRVTASSFGVAPSGQAWVEAGGLASERSTDGERAVLSNATVNVLRHDYIDVGSTDARVRAAVMLPVTPTGATIVRRLAARRQNASNYYAAVLDITTTGVVQLSLVRLVGGALTTLTGAGAIQVGTHTPGAWWYIDFELEGNELRAKAWPQVGLPPEDWQRTGVDTALTTGTGAGLVTRLNSGNTNVLPVTTYVDDFSATASAFSATTTTTGAYVRLSVTFTASQPEHVVTLTTVETALAGTVNVDAIQHEPGPAATAFTTDGPTLGPVGALHVERWPRTYTGGGFTGWCVAPCVDGMAALAAIKVDPEYIAAVRATLPAYFWALDDGDGAAIGLETSGNAGAALEPYDSNAGPGPAPEFGSELAIPGIPGGTGVRFTPFDPPNSNSAQYSFLSLGRLRPGIQFPKAYGSTWSASVSAWVKFTQTSPSIDMMVAAPFGPGAPGSFVPVALQLDALGRAAAFSSSQTVGIFATGDTFLDDDQPHHLVATVTQVDGGNTTLTILVDGVEEEQTVVTTASLGGLYSLPATLLNVGATGPSGIAGGGVVNGTVQSVGLWERALTSTEIAALHAAGATAFTGETTGTRLARHLASADYAGATRINPGSTTLQAATGVQLDALTDAQQLATVEAGTVWVGPDGYLTFEGRQQRWLRLTPMWVFGEDEAGGEIPYQEGIEFDFDPTFTFADVRAQRVNGTTAIGGTAAERGAVARKYFPRSHSVQGDYETDILAQYHADSIFHSHKAPLQRVSVITIDPAANPNLWRTALRLEVGQRCTVKRRAKAANGGAGLTMSADYFIEQITINEIDLETDRWTYSLFLSPIGDAAAPPYVTNQPWILENATYGVLDSTTVLGW